MVCNEILLMGTLHIPKWIVPDIVGRIIVSTEHIADNR